VIWQAYRLVQWHPFHRDIGVLAVLAVALGSITYGVKTIGPPSGLEGHLYRTAIGLAMIGAYDWIARRVLGRPVR
jgi:hypothetical protein